MGVKPPGYYVQRSSGLFPAPIPSTSPYLERICKHFELLGLFLAKCLQDGRRVDIPLSESFLKLMCFKQVITEESVYPLVRPDEEKREDSMSSQSLNSDGNTTTNNNPASLSNEINASGATGKEKIILMDEERTLKESSTKDASKDDEATKVQSSVPDGMTTTAPWFRGILTVNDLATVDPYRGKFLLQLQDLVKRKIAINTNPSLSETEKVRLVGELMLDDSSKLGELM